MARRMMMMMVMVMTMMMMMTMMNDDKCWLGCGECTLLQPPWESVQSFLRQLELALANDAPLFPEGSASDHRHTCLSMFDAALFTTGRKWKVS